VSQLEQFAIDGLELNDGTNYFLEELDVPPAQKKPEWVSGGDSDGSLLARGPLYDNATVTARVRIVVQSTMDLAIAKIAALGDKLQESERNQTGIALTWTPADGTIQATGRVLSGEITGLPITTQGDMAGWFVKTPVVTITMVRDPFWRGPEVSGGTTTASTLPVVTLELTSVTGDVPAEGRLVVTDAATQSRRLVRWGLESRYYPTSSPPGLILESDSLVTSGFAGTGTTRTGAYDPGAAGSSVVRGTLARQAIAVCGTGVQTHIGTFHVFARVWATVTTSGAITYLRLAWQDGEGPMRTNTYVTPPLTAAWTDVDLGIITTTTAISGTQKWIGRIDAYSSVVGETLDVDYIYLVPATEGYGEARGVYSYSPGVLVARDEYTSTTSGVALNARVAPTGGTWATSGSATDFGASDGPNTGDETMARTTSSDASERFAILGATNYTDVEVAVDHFYTGSSTATGAIVIARWVDSSNYVSLALTPPIPLGTLNLTSIVAAAGVTNSAARVTRVPSVWYRLRLVVYATGRAIGMLLDSAGVLLQMVTIQHSSIATGGALATGKPGFADMNTTATATSRYYDNFYVATPAAEPIVVYSGRTATFASTYAQRQDSTGTYAGDVPGYRGTRFYVPPAGTRTRKARVAVVVRRNDIAVAQDDQIADSTTVQALYTPRYINVPR
jgi:hypothetical protein